MTASNVLANGHAVAVPPDAEVALRAAAEAALRRELPFDSWFLFVKAHPGGVRVSGLARAGETAERVRRALAHVPGIGRVETDPLRFAGWPRSE